jgi:RND family efflux transporter MFP subunit
MAAEKNNLDNLKIDRRAGERRGCAAWIAGAVALLALVLAGAGWWWLRSQGLEVRTVAARELEVGGPRTLLNGSGYVVARREATVSSKVTGKVIEVLIEEGMRVEAGQVLARLDDTNVKASLQLAEAQLGAAKAALAEIRVRLDEAERELRRINDLAASRIDTQAALDHALADVNSQKARLESQQAAVTVAEKEAAIWQQQLEDTVIRAPFAGIVTVKNAQPGEMISPISAGGGFTRTGICTLVDMASLEIEVDVNESYINRVQTGQPVEATLDAYPDWKIPAKVIALIPTADRQKATVKVRVGFLELDPRMLPQMGVKVAFHEREPKTGGNRAVAVPKAAVQKQEGRDVVMVVQNGRVERRAVTLGGAKGEELLLLAGVAAGERVIVQAPRNLADRDRVRESKR